MILRRIATAFATVVIALSFAPAADARDTGWDCPGCRR